MWVPKLRIAEIVLILMLSMEEARSSCKYDRIEYFCGRKLVNTLSELCELYNSPTPAAYTRHRRQIVEECCRAPCSRRYLIEYYCLKVHDGILRDMEEDSYANLDHPKILEVDETVKTYRADDSRPAKEEMSNPNLLTVGINGTEKRENLPFSSKSTHFHQFRASDEAVLRRIKRKRISRKNRLKRVKKSRRLQPDISKLKRDAPPPNVGHIEAFQPAFYVLRLHKK